MYGAGQYFTSQWGKFSDKQLAHERVHKKGDRGQDHRVKISQAGGAHPWPIRGLNYVSGLHSQKRPVGNGRFCEHWGRATALWGASTENRLRAWRV